MAIFTNEQTVGFLVDQLKSELPNVVPQHLNGLNYKLWFTGNHDVAFDISFDDIVKTFSESNDFNNLIDFVQEQVLRYQKEKEASTEQVYIPHANLLPILRPKSFKLDGSSEVKHIQDTVSKEFEIFYAYFKDKKLNFVSQENMAADLNHDKLTDIAFANLKRMGWHAEEQVMAGPSLDLMVFGEASYPYQAQFILKEWTQEYLGPLFHFTIPNESAAFVMVSDGVSGAFGGTPDGPTIAMLLNQVSNQFTRQTRGAKRFSSVVHKVKDGKLQVERPRNGMGGGLFGG